MPQPGPLTERQQKWFAAVHDGLERDTGKTLAAWTALALACPETAHRKRLAWMKAEHGLGQNRASMVLNAAFPPAIGWAAQDALADIVWADPAARAIFEAVRDAASALPDVLIGQRKGYTAFSRKFQFAAAKPVRGGVLLGLAVTADFAPGLEAGGKEGWSERLVSRVLLREAAAVQEALRGALRAAWERS